MKIRFDERDYLMNINHIKIEEPFDTKYSTWIIAFCPDTNSFFVTNERHFFWESEEEFDSEEAGINYFENHIQRFLTVANLRDYTERIWLENTQKWYI